MRLLPINSAEAIFEPFFDPDITELAAWTIGAPGAEGISHRQGWAFVTVNWVRPAPDGLVLAVLPAVRSVRLLTLATGSSPA